MTSLVAILPAANLLAANTALETAGFGKGNFSVASFTGGAATHAALHAWHDAAFVAAVKAIAGVVTDEGTGDPVTRTKALIEAQGAQRDAGGLVGGVCLSLPSPMTSPQHAGFFASAERRAE